MNFPKIIKTDSGEYPIEDVHSFKLVHKSYQNGLVIRVNLKKELMSFFSSYHKDRNEFGLVKRKYDLNDGGIIRIKDMPEFRKELYAELMKEKTQSKTVGINAGTPIAQSKTFNYKEMVIQMNEDEK